MTTVYGWWDWDAEAPGMVNRVTGERVVLRGKVEAPDLLPPDQTWLRFDYRHPELEFPVLARERIEAWQFRGKPEHLVSWTVDYHLSAKLWQREANTVAKQPSYGAWRRVDDCLTDALACWPAVPVIGHRLGDVYLRGGWHNGAWSSDLRRSYRRITEQDHSRASTPVADAWIFPLDTPAPSPWVFHSFPPEGDTGQVREIEVEVLLDGMGVGHQDRSRYFDLPAGLPLTGQEGRTAYLRTEDGKRLLYPRSADHHKSGGHSRETFHLIYADEEIICEQAVSHGIAQNDAVEWSTFASWRGSGWRERPGGVITEPPTREQWLRLKWALFDGWLNWGGTTARCPLWWKELKLARAYAVDVGHAYWGGVRAAHFRARVTGVDPMVSASVTEIIELAQRLWSHSDLKAAFQRVGRHGDLTEAEQGLLATEIKAYRSGDLWNRNQNDLALAAFLLRRLAAGSIRDLNGREVTELLAERKMPPPGSRLMTLRRREAIDFAKLLQRTPDAWAVIKRLGKGPFPAIWEVDKEKVLDRLEADFRAKYGLFNRAGFELTADLWRAAARGRIRGFDSPKALAMLKSNRFVRADDAALEPVSGAPPWTTG